MVHGPSAARYLSFGPILAGIELLGACLDDEPWHQDGLSEVRFRDGVGTIMAGVDKRYGRLNAGNNKVYDLYSMLRGGMAHVLKPEDDFAFIGEGTAKEKGLTHLEINHKSGKMTLVAEDFFEHFRTACDNLLKGLPTLEGRSKKAANKLQGIFLPISY